MLMSVVVMGIGFVNGEWVLAHLSLSTLRRLCPGVKGYPWPNSCLPSSASEQA